MGYLGWGFKISDGKQDKSVVRMTPMPEDGTENASDIAATQMW